MSGRYILNANGDPEPCEDLMTWGRWMERGNRHIELDERDGVKVSTVFMGLDHAFGGSVPILFETMIFGGPEDGYQERYATRDEAVAGHATALALAFGAVA